MAKGTIGVTTENIFPVIKQFLYSDHDIFVRELVANAVDATLKLKALASSGEFKGELGDLTIHVDVDNKKNILNRQMYVPATKIHAEYSISYIREYDMCLIVMKDVTERVNYDSKLQEVKLEALSITDDVIRKQMLVAQQIASLLGETTAETKVALVNLKKTLDDGDKTV